MIVFLTSGFLLEQSPIMCALNTHYQYSEKILSFFVQVFVNVS
jgi:hypothetical protein